MDTQILKTLSPTISKNPSSESYYLSKFFKDKLLDEYSSIRFMEQAKDGFVAPGIKDSELLELLIHRAVTVHYKFKNQEDLIKSLNDSLDYILEIENNCD